MKTHLESATSWFRVFRKSICANVETAIDVTKAVVVLDNFLMKDHEMGDSRLYFNNGNENIQIQNEGIENITQRSSNNYSGDAKQVRDDFGDYFN